MSFHHEFSNTASKIIVFNNVISEYQVSVNKTELIKNAYVILNQI